VEKALGPIVEELSIPPTAVSKISEGHIDEAWVKVLAEVDKRATAQKKNAQHAQTKALADVGPLLEKLVLKVQATAAPGSSAFQCIMLTLTPRRSSGYGTFSSRRSRH
jgi:hypothetical protein